MMTRKELDVITFGRSSIDLYSQNVGADFVDITGFDAFVGGSPLNIAVGCRRLGLSAGILTGIGDDKVGDFILHFLTREDVVTKYISRVRGARSSAVILGIQPPDKFPLVYYRHNAADLQITLDDVDAANIQNCRLLEISGTALSREPSRSAACYAAEIAFENGVPVVLDIDFRSDQWDDIRSFGVTTRALLPKVNIAMGTEEEILAVTLNDISRVRITDQQISAPVITGDVKRSVQKILSSGVETLIVKTGAKGVTIYDREGGKQEVPGFPVEVVNVLGAGDAFASGFIYGYLQGWDLYRACRMGNASGAQVVLQRGCANFMPYLQASMTFIQEKGGF